MKCFHLKKGFQTQNDCKKPNQGLLDTPGLRKSWNANTFWHKWKATAVGIHFWMLACVGEEKSVELNAYLIFSVEGEEQSEVKKISQKPR